jgi:NAD(P)-dependent dehydrogenase (short-subunit alcohol dehydrogenase family)
VPQAQAKAVISFTKALAIDYGKQGIRANCIAPGSIARISSTRETVKPAPSWTPPP